MVGRRVCGVAITQHNGAASNEGKEQRERGHEEAAIRFACAHLSHIGDGACRRKSFTAAHKADEAGPSDSIVVCVCTKDTHTHTQCPGGMRPERKRALQLNTPLSTPPHDCQLCRVR